MIATISGGLPRTINLIADRALAIGCERQTWTIDTAVVLEAGRELGLTVPPDRRIPSSFVRVAAAAALVAAIAWVGWWSITSTTRSGAPEGLSAGAATPAADASSGRTPSNPQAADAAEPSAGGPVAAHETFSIVVASFRASARAAAVASEVTSLGLQASTRATSGWQQVLAGPYQSRTEAVAAQEKLKNANMAGTHIVSTAPSGLAASPSPALLTEAGPPVPAPTGTPAESARPPVQTVSSAPNVSREDDLLERARALSQLPDVKGIEHLRADLLKRTSFSDPRQDPAVVAVDRHLEEARTLQLTVDARDLRRYEVEEYRTALLGIIPDLDETSAALAAWSIGLGARPDSQTTAALASRLRAFEPPREVAAAHERLCLSLESLTTTLAAPGSGDPASQTSRVLAEITQAKGTLQEFLRTSTTTRPRP
jgi:hypothetical protein